MPSKPKNPTPARTRLFPPSPPPRLLEDDPDQEEIVPLSAGEEEAYEQITRIRDQLGAEEARVVLRRRSGNGTLHHVGVMSAVDFDIERVIKDYGGGRYEASFYTKGVKRDAVTFDIDPSIPARLPSTVVEKEQPEPAPYPQRSWGEDPSITALKEVLTRQSDLLNQLVVNMATGGMKGNGDTSQTAIDLALKMVEIISQKTPTPESTPVAELREMFVAGIEAAHAAEGGGEKDSYWPVLNKFADPVIKVLETVLARERGGGQGRVAPPARSVAAVAAAPRQPSPVVEEVDPNVPSWLIHLKPHLPALLAWARAGKDTELYAEVILDNLDQGAILEIQAAAQDPQFVEKTLAVLPMFRPYSAWASAILTNIKTLVLAPPEDGGQTDDAGGGSGDG